MQLSITRKTKICLPAGEHHSIHQATQLLINDLELIFGDKPSLLSEFDLKNDRNHFVILSADNPVAAKMLQEYNINSSAVKGQWESYLYTEYNGNMIILGGDSMGTLRAVYAFSRDFLGVDPWIRWTEIMPEKQDEIWIDIPNPTVIPSPTFKFRGWFLNNSHLINWNMGNGPLEDFQTKYAGMIDAGLSGAFGQETAEMVAETCLRMEMNFLIPLSCWNIGEPHERLVADICHKYFIVQRYGRKAVNCTPETFSNFRKIPWLLWPTMVESK